MNHQKLDLQELLQFSLRIIFIVIATLALFFSIRYASIVTMNKYEIPIISQNSPLNYSFLILIGLSFITMQPIIDKFNPRIFLTIIIILFFVISLYLIYHSSTFLRQSDPKNCLEVASHLNNGNFVDLKKEKYLGWYPYQIYWITFLRPLVRISNSVKFFYFLNLIYQCIIFIIFYKITKSFTNKVAVLNNVSLMLLCFLPNIFNILFIYGNVPGYMFFLLSLYFLLRVLKGEDRIFLMIFSVLTAYFIKNNYLIGIIALIITVLITNLAIRKKIVTVIITVGLAFIISTCISAYYSHFAKDNFNVGSGMPKEAFVVMGLQDYMGLKNGWYDGYTLQMFRQNNYSAKLTKKQAKKDLDKRIYELRNSPSKTIKFFEKKLVSTWSDSTFQSLWVAPWQNKTNKNLKYFYRDSKKNLV